MTSLIGFWHFAGMSMLAFLFYLLLAAQVLRTTPGNGANQQGQADQNQQSSGQISTPTPQTQRIPGANDRSSKKEKEKEQSSRYTRYIRRAAAPEYFSQWVLVGIGAVGVIFGLRSLALLRRQIEIEADALTLARVSADAAKQSAEVATQSLHTLERARIAVSDLRFLIAADRKTFKYSFIMTNTGSTPAQIFELRYSKLSMNFEDTEYIKALGEHRYSGIPPVNENFTLPAGQYSKTTTHDAMKFRPNEEPVLYALGYVKYRDIFNAEQRTNFAFKYCGEGMVAELVTIPGFNTAT